MKKTIYNYTNKLLGSFGLRIVKSRTREMPLLYIHDYGDSGYEKYKETQIFYNKQKIDKIWADDDCLTVISEFLNSSIKEIDSGICHGARNGYEVKKFRELLGCEVIGSDISDTAHNFPNMVQWDFHEVNPDWINNFDFIYSNSLDQSFDPQKALNTWIDQIKPNGLLFIEHTMAHSPSGAGEMDPFGAHPLIMPYLFFEWGRDKYSLKEIIRPNTLKFGKLEVWIFVLAKKIYI